jgi:enamine deaminase RidA (YjgF/YER057c/UK114 family)
LKIFGDKGKHARFAIGVPCLPINACVELELLVEV